MGLKPPWLVALVLFLILISQSCHMDTTCCLATSDRNCGLVLGFLTASCREKKKSWTSARTLKSLRESDDSPCFVGFLNSWLFASLKWTNSYILLYSRVPAMLARSLMTRATTVWSELFSVIAFFPAYWQQWSGYFASLGLDLRQALERSETAPDMCTKVWWCFMYCVKNFSLFLTYR